MFGPRPSDQLLNALFGASPSRRSPGRCPWPLPHGRPDSRVLYGHVAVHIFYTSQNLKEAPVALLTYAAIGAAFAAASMRKPRSRGQRHWLSPALRCWPPPSIDRTSVGLGAALTPSACRLIARPANAVMTAVVLILALALYPSAAHFSIHFIRGPGSTDQNGSRPSDPVIRRRREHHPETDIARRDRPLPRVRQSADGTGRRPAGQEIGTQTIPERPSRPGSTSFYLPKGAFTVLFMRCRGYIPDGKIGRWAAAGKRGAAPARSFRRGGSRARTENARAPRPARVLRGDDRRLRPP